MTRAVTRGTTRKTLAAADALRDWLQTQTPPPRSAPIPPASPDSLSDGTSVTAPADARLAMPSADALVDTPTLATADLPQADRDAAALLRPAFRATRPDDGERAAPLRLAHTDWLHHRLTVSGPAAQVAALQKKAAGAGVIPWQLDLDRLAEDVFHLLAAPPPPHRRSLSLAGARILAGQLRDAVARRHTLAVTRVGQSRVCPFDLHALLPIPAALLRSGPDDPDALAWLWTRWGTTEALRHVTMVGAAFPDEAAAPAPNEAAFRVTFWSADWTPWRALAHLAACWPALRFAVRPTYEAP